MNLKHPTIKKIISDAELQIRELTGDKTVSLSASCRHKASIDFKQLIETVCSVTNVPFNEAIKKNRTTRQRRTRQLISYYAYGCCNITNKYIGEELGGRHHTTILAARKKIQDLIDTNDSEVCSYVNKINELLNAPESVCDLTNALVPGAVREQNNY
jgi:chromosomal replication initiation ATPase DnaA